MSRRNKKGITPLMATLLLIAFAVALGIVIMNFGRAQVDLEAQCAIEIGLKFSEIGGKKQICLDEAKQRLFLVVENGVNIKVEGIVVNIIGTEDALTYELTDAIIAKAGVFMRYVPYDTVKIGELRQIKIVPKVNLYDEELICQEQAIVLETIDACTG